MTTAQQHDAYHTAVLASENIRQAEVAAIEHVFQAGLTGLLANRPFVAGAVGVETLATGEREQIVELQRVRDDAIGQTERDHQQRVADAARRRGTASGG